MRLSFLPLHGLSGARPAAQVFVEGLPETSLLCMLDTGSLHSLFGGWVARQAGISLEGAPELQLAVAGHALTARFATVRFYLGRHTWEAEVGFCDEWPWDHQILGLEGFFRWFDVTISAVAKRTIIVPTAV